MKIGNAAYSSFCWITICRISQLGSPGIWIPQGHYKAALICGHLVRTKAIAVLCFTWGIAKFPILARGQKGQACRYCHYSSGKTSKTATDLSRVLKAWILAERAYLLG
ncbi:hypothetical protein E1A91_A05G331500v1 [Gossypium mustelinum]|uniref:Uncharacterized protein n=1 Tax=Gossypium mustelinum TaxID=34275 RepID=A0A5D2ZFL0_GOSMU|nr:hypothetical protein E1A91_A05G331500v1 [Gossypium mustelinum]